MRKIIKIQVATFFYFFHLLLSEAWCLEAVCLFDAGDEFPEIIFQTLLSRQEKDYLGISENQKNVPELSELYSFTLLDVQADLVIVEFLNVHCVSCQAQAPVMNAVYKLIQRDDYLHERVKIIGICPGNTFHETQKFRKEKTVPFPCIPDPDFEAYEAIGGQCGTPFILMVRRDGQECIITWSHIGQISSPLYFMQEAWDALNTDLQVVVQKARQKRSVKVVMEKPKPFISDKEMEQKIRASMERQRLDLKELKKIVLSNNEEIFIGKAMVEGAEKLFFSKLISRNPVCDLCHAIHFILTFDEHGVIVDFVHIHITKYGNEEWSIPEIMQTREKLIGKSVLKPLIFNPEVDAVSLATMSCALIFNSVQRTARYYKELQQKGYIKQ